MDEIRKIKCAGAIFIDDDHRVLLEDRRRIKKHGEHWSFFGGTMKPGETEVDTLKREIEEEMAYTINAYEFFKKYEFMPIKTLHLTYYMYIASAPDLKEVKIHEKALAKFFTLKQALRLKITDIDKQIIRDVQIYLKKKELPKN